MAVASSKVVVGDPMMETSSVAVVVPFVAEAGRLDHSLVVVPWGMVVIDFSFSVDHCQARGMVVIDFPFSVDHCQTQQERGVVVHLA